MGTTELEVRIESEGGALTLTPESLLQYYLPGAKLVPGREDVYQGGVTTQQGNSTVYIHKATLIGALMDCREKHLNPVSQIYILPSNSPDKRSGHKIKYQAGLERARKIPGFLGMNSGLLVRRGSTICETHGAADLEGDTILGAWAEAYVAGLNRPIRHEVDAREFTGSSLQWKTRGKFMLVKVALDQLCYLKLAPMYADQQPANGSTHSEENRLILEANDERVAPQSTPPMPTAAEEPARSGGLEAGRAYVGSIKEIVPRGQRDGKQIPGWIIIDTEHGPVQTFFWSRPDTLKDHDDWTAIIGLPCSFTFSEKPDKQGRNFRYLGEFDVAFGPANSNATVGPEGEELVL